MQPFTSLSLTDRALDVGGFVVAAALLALARWLLAPMDKPRVRLPLVYLLLA